MEVNEVGSSLQTPRAKKEKVFDPVAFAKQVMRRATRKTRGYNRALMRASYLEAQPKLDGTIGGKVRRWWVCEGCGRDKLNKKEVEVDHITPIALTSTLEEWIIALYCDESQLQVLCKGDNRDGCHPKKTALDRDRIALWKKSRNDGQL
jgi:hypothetical protein